MNIKDERLEKVRAFQDACLSAGFRKEAENIYLLNGSSSKTLTLCTLIHGNEIGGIEVFLTLLQEIRLKKITPKSRLRMILGNVDAFYEDQRFLQTDMNRSFGLKNHASAEELRAREIEEYFRKTDVLVDIHQTIGPTSTPFFIFETEERSLKLARHLHPTIPIVTNSLEREFHGKTSTAFTISQGGMAVTLETGQKAIDEKQISLGLAIAMKAVETDFEEPLPDVSLGNAFTFSQIINNPGGNLELTKTYQNFDPVKKGEVLARNHEAEIRALVDGVILFPKYGAYARASKELALILRPVTSGALE